ncbi:hypothetical protein [Caballeronia terrestris]|uniref:hypothetical protein n=1 Tax=Caballeronia terrestris TaxID=1226301 RepID=UPI00135C067F|nr:hypothetical protein [Caballeronia terrestris]
MRDDSQTSRENPSFRRFPIVCGRFSRLAAPDGIGRRDKISFCSNSRPQACSAGIDPAENAAAQAGRSTADARAGKTQAKKHASIDALPSRSQAGRLSRADTLKQGARFIDPARGTEKGNGGSFEMGQHQA